MGNDETNDMLQKNRKKTSVKRPKFSKFESWRLVRLKDHWRKPKGIDNKMRQKRRGWPKTVNIGYGSHKASRGLHPSGKKEVIVYNIGDLAIIDPYTEVARIGSSVGKRKRNVILEDASKRGIKVLNPGDIIDELRSVSDKEEELDSDSKEKDEEV